jgi:hypothetical protein
MISVIFYSRWGRKGKVKDTGMGCTCQALNILKSNLVLTGFLKIKNDLKI